MATIAAKRADTYDGRRWVAIAKGGEYSPYYRNLELVLNWGSDGAECKAFIANYRGNKGWGFHWAAALNGYVDYFRPGVTWSRRTSTWISGRALPAGCIFGDKGPAAFIPTDEPAKLTEVLAWMNSSVVSALLELSVGKEGSQGTAAASSYEVGIVERLPYPADPNLTRAGKYALDAVLLRQERALTDELNRLFTGPQLQPDDFQTAARLAHSLQLNIDTSVGKAFGLTDETIEEVKVNSRLESLQPAAPFELVLRERVQDHFLHLQFVVGCVFGRWNVETLARTPVLPGPFDVLPDYPPAAAFGDHKTAITAILVEDEGHPHDIVRRCSDLVENTRVPLQLPGNLRPSIQNEFFSKHIAAYSRSRRRAPIYWQLSTPSAQYSVWLYPHACTGETLYEVQNEYVAPKLEHEEKQLAILRAEHQSTLDAQGRKQIAMREGLVEELRRFLNEVKRIAPLWKPKLDDGMAVTFSPLWRLVPQHRSWQKELKSRWDELVAGEYDWAHVAMHLWPERVVPKCTIDHSLALAHGLEHVFWVQDLSGHWRQRISIADTIRYLEDELYSDRLRQTVDELVSFSQAHPAITRDGTSWWTALSTGAHDDQPIALALWPERVLLRAVADPTRFTSLGIKPPRARSEAEFLAKLLNTHVPRLSEDELQALNEFCGEPGDRDAWRERWAEFVAGIHDRYALARAVYCARVVATAQTDADLAEKQDLFRWFWLSRSCGPRRLKEPPDEIADAVRERTSFAVKAALKSLLEAPAADAGGGRGHARRAVTAAADGGTR